MENQATDRAYRIGQERFVHVHKLITTGTIEEKIDAMLETKQTLNDQIIQSTLDNLIVQRLFRFEHGINFFFNRSRRNEFVNMDEPFLADSVGAVGRLVFHRRIPPSVIVSSMFTNSLRRERLKKKLMPCSKRNKR